jgi:hypothetical protein
VRVVPRVFERFHRGDADIPKLESTACYLGVEVDDAIEIAEKIDI